MKKFHSSTVKTVLVTGGNRGIGLEVCRQLGNLKFRIYLSGKNKKKVARAAAQLRKEGLSVVALTLDVTNLKSINAAVKKIKKLSGSLDVLVNNAGGNFDSNVDPFNSEFDFIRATFDLNFFSVWQVTKQFLPLLERGKSARIVNVSSGSGTFSDPVFGLEATGGYVPSYSTAKLALNGLTIKMAHALKSKKILVNAVCPGFTATFEGARQLGARSIETGAASVVWATQIDNKGPTGGFFRDGKKIGW